MKKILFALLLLAFAGKLLAQTPADSAMLAAIAAAEAGTPKEKDYVTATFKSSRIINGQSVEIVKPNHLEFRISHRFGSVRDGLEGFFGLDNAQVRLALEYGINRWIMVGVGRSSFGRAVDGLVKVKLLQQQTTKVPLSITLFANAAVNTGQAPYPNYRFDSRLNYCAQLLIARKFGERFSLQLSPTVVHRNLVPTADYPNTLLAMGVGGRVKLTNRLSLNAEYFYRLRNETYRAIDPYRNSLSVGVDIDTGGHIFALHFTNSRGQIEHQFIGNTDFDWAKGDFSFGFNITRQFSFKKQTADW